MRLQTLSQRRRHAQARAGQVNRIDFPEPKAVDVTILFSDVRGFTRISEALEPAPSAGWDGVTVFDEK